MMHRMNLKEVEEAADILLVVAKKRIPEKGWSLLITYWDDGTFQLEYRHGNEEGVHRFFYAPHKHPYRVRYYLFSNDNWMTCAEGSFEIDSNVVRSENINLATFI